MGGPRGPLRLLAVALGASAALVVLQTIVLRSVPYDAPAFGVVTAMFRATFLAADVASFAALLMLGRRAPSVHPFTMLGLVVVGLMILSAVAGWLVPLAGKGNASSLGGIEPMLAFGASLLVAFALAATVPPTAAPDVRRSIAFGLAIAAAIGVVALRVGSSFDRVTNMPLAWVRFVLTIVPPASLAIFAVLVSRAKEIAGPSLDVAAATAAAAGGYRGAGEGSATAPRPELAAPGPATIEPLRIAASGVHLLRIAFIVRAVIGGVALFTLFFGFSGITLFVFPLVGVATSVAIVVGLLRQRRLASFRGGAALVGAIVAFAVSGACELLSTFVTAERLFATGYVRSDGMLLVPIATFFMAVGVVLVARTHERAGELLYKYRLASLARWTQGAVVLSATSSLCVFAALARSGYRHRDSFGPLLAAGFALLMTASFIAIVVFLIKTLNEASRVLGERHAQAVSAAGVAGAAGVEGVA